MGWIEVCGSDRAELGTEVRQRVASKISQGRFRSEDVDYIARIDRRLVEGTLNIDAVRLEKLRRLCQLWEVELKIGEITSHRKLVGPLIVACKKLLLPMLRMLFKDTLRQQRDFNAAAISLLTELCQEKRT